jgi:uncharacterized membrane protein YgcG
MEGTTLKTSTTPDNRNPRRSRTKSLLGILVATALLAGATQALAPASASAMINMEQFLCALEGKTWDEDKGECNRSGNDDVGGGSTGGGWNTGTGGGGNSGVDPELGYDPNKPVDVLPGPPAADRTPDIIVPLITSDGERWDAIYFPVDSLGVPLERRRSNGKGPAGFSPRRGEGHGRSHGGGGRRRSSRD